MTRLTPARPRPRAATSLRRPGRNAARATRVAALAVAVAAATACTGPTTAAEGGPGRDVGVQLFQWTWDAIGTECTTHLGPAGYAWVLTSPPQEHVTGPAWWTSYQPVSYRLESRLGTREEFAAMVDACHEAGVEVWADAVVNHMTGQQQGTGWAGSTFTHYAYPGLYDEDDFHHCGMTADGDIADYGSALQVRTCELLDLADLDTGAPRVRETLGAYLHDLASLGVDGFRIDAAKHMAPDDIAAVLAAADLPAGTGVVQEVIRGAGEPVTPEQYVGNGTVTEFAWSEDVRAVVRGAISAYPDLGGDGYDYLPSDDAVVFVDNHDTERNGQSLRYDSDGYALAQVLTLAGTYGTPVVLSGYAFTDTDAGPRQDARGAVLDATCDDDPGPQATLADGDFVCQHRWAVVEGMVGWRAAVGDAPLVDVQVEDDALAFGRGQAGFLVVNAGRSPLRTRVHTSLPDGRYCDVLVRAADGGVPDPVVVDVDAVGGCAGSVLEVVGGEADVTVPPGTAQAWRTA